MWYYSIHDDTLSTLCRHIRHRLSRISAVVIDRHSLSRNIISVIFHHDPYFGPSVDILGPKVSCTATVIRGPERIFAPRFHCMPLLAWLVDHVTVWCLLNSLMRLGNNTPSGRVYILRGRRAVRLKQYAIVQSKHFGVAVPQLSLGDSSEKRLVTIINGVIVEHSDSFEYITAFAHLHDT